MKVSVESSETDTIEQYWDVKINTDNPVYPFVVIDNWYTPNEEKAVWKELDFYSTMPKENTLRAEDTLVARDRDGTPRSESFRFYITDFYKKENLSPIFNCRYKQRSPEFHKIIGECVPYARSFMSSNADNALISYYEENDHYRPHHDTSLWTNLIWMVKEPRLFNGGDFILDDIGVKIKLKSNRAIFFPCCYYHSVTPVKFHTEPKERGYGRYCITHFYYNQPEIF